MKEFSEMTFNDIAKLGFLIMTVIGFTFAIYFSFNNLQNPDLINIIMAFPFILLLTPYLVMSLFDIKKVESKMTVISRFIRDVVDNVESGMDLITSIKTTTGNEYSVLNEDIKKLSNQLSWGVDFDKALMNFADNVGSKDLKRDFRLVIEARRVGGHVEKILRELSLKINTEIMRQRERRNNLASNTFTGYVSFIIFIMIIILVYNSLFQGTTQAEEDVSGVANESSGSKIYLSLLILLSYELAILSGFLFGMMQEGNVISGAPHVVLLTLVTFLGFFFFVTI